MYNQLQTNPTTILTLSGLTARENILRNTDARVELDIAKVLRIIQTSLRETADK